MKVRELIRLLERNGWVLGEPRDDAKVETREPLRDSLPRGDPLLRHGLNMRPAAIKMARPTMY